MAREGASTFSIVIRIALFIAIAVLIILFQADRSARSSPAFAMQLPAGMGGFADFERARFLLTRNPELAVASAENTLRYRPVPARHLSLYAQAKVEAGEVEPAAAALTLAASRGWRDQYVQIMALASAVDAGNPTAALQRFQALVRARRDEDAVALAGAAILDSEAARGPFIDALEADPELARRTIGLARASDLFAVSLAPVLASAERGGDGLDCDVLADYVSIMLLKNMADAARPAWPDRCATVSNDDLTFANAQEGAPFAWSFPREGAVTTTMDAQTGRLDARNRSPAKKQIALRYLTLPAGAHTIDASQTNLAGPGVVGGQADLELRMRCGGRGSKRNIPVRSPIGGTFDFTVPADCPIQFLGVFIGRGRVQDLALSVR